MTEATSRPISRRTVAKGAAWTAPVIFGGVAAPAYASSGGPPSVAFTSACKLPGKSCDGWSKGYIFTLTVSNTSHRDVWVYAPTFTTVGTNLTLTYQGYIEASAPLSPIPGPIPIPAGTSRTIKLYATSSNSSNQVFDLTMTAKWGHTSSYGADPEQGDHDLQPLSIDYTVLGTAPDCSECNAVPAPAARSSESTPEMSAPAESTPSPDSEPLAPDSQPESTVQTTPAS